ncbi:MAG: hypothetical protein ACOCV9_01785 [Marinilabiliaceae bacterium]
MQITEKQTKYKTDFTDEFDSLTLKQSRIFKKRFMQETGLTDVSMYNAVRGKEWIREDRLKYIERLFREVKKNHPPKSVD